MKSTIQDKANYQFCIFESHDKYDLMNDVMSFGDTVFGKISCLTGWILLQFFLDRCRVRHWRYSETVFKNKNLSKVTCVEPTNICLKKEKVTQNFKNIEWVKSRAENLPVKDNMFDFTWLVMV